MLHSVLWAIIPFIDHWTVWKWNQYRMICRSFQKELDRPCFIQALTKQVMTNMQITCFAKLDFIELNTLRRAFLHCTPPLTIYHLLQSPLFIRASVQERSHVSYIDFTNRFSPATPLWMEYVKHKWPDWYSKVFFKNLGIAVDHNHLELLNLDSRASLTTWNYLHNQWEKKYECYLEESIVYDSFVKKMVSRGECIDLYFSIQPCQWEKDYKLEYEFNCWKSGSPYLIRLKYQQQELALISLHSRQLWYRPFWYTLDESTQKSILFILTYLNRRETTVEGLSQLLNQCIGCGKTMKRKPIHKKCQEKWRKLKVEENISIKK